MLDPDVAVATPTAMVVNSQKLAPYLDDHSMLPEAHDGSLKQRKVLPHPQNGHQLCTDVLPQPHELVLDPAQSASTSSLSSSKNDGASDKLNGVGLPPTPPGHSRSSSSGNSALPSSPTYVASPVQSNASVVIRSSGTPPNQKSPPTPDVTPPARERRPKALRPSLIQRLSSKATTDSYAGSRSESFITAQEFPSESDDDDRSTVKPASSVGGTTPQDMARRDVTTQSGKGEDGSGGLSSENEQSLTPRSRKEFSVFDGDWASPQGEVEQQWDDNLNRNVTVRQKRPRPNNQRPRGVTHDTQNAPANATKTTAVQQVQQVQERARYEHSPAKTASKSKRTNNQTPVEPDPRADMNRWSALSSKSATSTAVDFVSGDSPPRKPRTLRHVKKQVGLRDSTADFSPASSGTLTNSQVEGPRQSRPPLRAIPGRPDSLASTNTVNSIASRKARREVWKNGGIPVIVIPNRTVSNRSTKPPSLRSTSSRHSRRSNSLGSTQGPPKMKDVVPNFNTQQYRKPRSMSVSSSSFVADQLTMDYPPIVPRRTSSLSAPTSRNGSRAASVVGSRSGSLTAESLQAHNAIQQEQRQPAMSPPALNANRQPSITISGHTDAGAQLQPVRSMESQRSAMEHRPSTDINGDPFFGKRLTTFNTPFSQASVETNGTGTFTHSIADVSEARVVNIFPHQNKSVLMVDHKSKSSEETDAREEWQPGDDKVSLSTRSTQRVRPMVQVPPSNTRVPVTPPQVPQIRMDDVDSPLRNPRAPPLPPAIQLTPATPSGMTPAHDDDKMRDGYFAGTSRKPSLVQRALSLRKTPENGVPRRISLLRALSISRNIRKDTAENPDLAKNQRQSIHQYPNADDPPSDESKLHPFWRPAHEDGDDDCSSDDEDYDFPDDVDRVYRYPAADTRSRPRRRDSLTARLKHTFAILPIEDDRHYSQDDVRDTRRTIKRTPSGNLRVTRYEDGDEPESLPMSRSSSRRWSLSSRDAGGRPSSAPDQQGQKTWGTEKQVDARGRRMFPNWQDKLERVRPSSLTRRLSEHRRQKRTDALRQKISGPREVRDGVGDVVRRNSNKGSSYQTSSWQEQQEPRRMANRADDDMYTYRGNEDVQYWNGRRI